MRLLVLALLPTSVLAGALDPAPGVPYLSGEGAAYTEVGVATETATGIAPGIAPGTSSGTTLRSTRPVTHRVGTGAQALTGPCQRN